MMSLEAQYAILDIVELEFRLSPPPDSNKKLPWIYFPTRRARPIRQPYLKGQVSASAIAELIRLGYVDQDGSLSEAGTPFYEQLSKAFLTSTANP